MITHDPTPDPSRDDAVQWIMHALTPMLRPGVNEDGRLQLPGDDELATARRLFEKIVAALEEAETSVAANLRAQKADLEAIIAKQEHELDELREALERYDQPYDPPVATDFL